MSNYVIGLDYGTDSVRCLLVNADTGEEIATNVFQYPRWSEGKFCLPEENQFRHHPLDYLEGLETTVKNCLAQVSDDIRKSIKAISVDTTGSTPAPVDKNGQVLALNAEFSDNPNAMFILWKDHTGVGEAAEINKASRNWGGTDYTMFEGGVYSSEWFWSKILHTIRVDEKVRRMADSWVELCDWIPAILTGTEQPAKIARGRCAAGHKAMWHESWGGLPAEDYLAGIDPLLKGLRDRLYHDTLTADQKVGTLTGEWAKRLNLNSNVIVGIGAFDAHMGAIGANIQPYSLVKIIGTSTCDVLVAPKQDIGDKCIKGICGQVDGSVIPGLIGFEAGQSAFGDIYAWFRDLISWPLKNLGVESRATVEIGDKIIPALSKSAAVLPISASGALAIDWHNGRRSPYANQTLKGTIAGLSLGSDAPRIFKSLVEATGFGARAINECIESQGVRIQEIIAIGGISKKSDFVMQTLSDILNRPIKICKTEQACALGAAMCAAVAGGIHANIEEAQNKMNSGTHKAFAPIKENVKRYEVLYKKYSNLGRFLEQSIEES